MIMQKSTVIVVCGWWESGGVWSALPPEVELRWSSCLWNCGTEWSKWLQGSTVAVWRRWRHLLRSKRGKSNSNIVYRVNKNILAMDYFSYTHSHLHPNNSLVCLIKLNLCGLYGRLPGWEMPNLTPQNLKRKKDLCEELIAVLNVLDPGISGKKGWFVRAAIMFFLTRCPLSRQGGPTGI